MGERPVNKKPKPRGPDGENAKARARTDRGREQRDGEDAGSVDAQRKNQKPKRRRKVNHACLYCRRSHMTCDLERPCTRCIKRNIGHLCHDEPRNQFEYNAAAKTAAQVSQGSDVPMDAPGQQQPAPASQNLSDGGTGRMGSGFENSSHGAASSFDAGDVMGQGNTLPLVTPGPASGLQGNAFDAGVSDNANQFSGFSDAWLTAQNYNDMSAYNPNYMIGPEVTHEFNLLNDFLQPGLLDEPGIAPDDMQQAAAFGKSGPADMLPSFVDGGGGQGLPIGVGNPSLAGGQGPGSMLPPPRNADGRSISRPGSAVPGDRDKTREYYLQAADPSGNDTPEERMSRVLRAKYEAGLLKPFNYINGYARLGKFLDGHIAASSKQKILRTINQFRPKFREKAQGLTDMQLVYVEMWFEKQLMDYDRVFASMAVPACCWRRTGEIFRGNKEMAELINVPVDQLRDGKIALHDILTEESMVRYWEEFGTIAFDPAHETLLTACSLKSPSSSASHAIVKCCFSFTIKRDEHKLPALIVGNFLPHDPPAS